jgi:hypothetical protein
VKAKAAVSYSTAVRGGETATDQRQANISVLLEVDPRYRDMEVVDDPELERKLAKQAQLLADEMFLSRHPRAHIEHS